MLADSLHDSTSEYSCANGELHSLVWRIHKPECLALSSGVTELDALFAKGIHYGTVIEWGLPQGRNGRILPILFLRHDIPSTVWIYPDADMDVYAPAWASHGVDLRRIVFVKSDEPVTKLKPLFMDDVFTIIVLDSPRKLSKGALSFISIQARMNQQIVFLLRNFFLSSKRGNTFAAVRLNGSQDRRGFFRVNVIKGEKMTKIILPKEKVWNAS